mmetsp:Transcript_19323/g.30432  ORF Transcript_19323/g.30432 Transcript_19323/m.30432 type:complete len:222 (+) Transcript_19323:550-1215(+)
MSSYFEATRKAATPSSWKVFRVTAGAAGCASTRSTTCTARCSVSGLSRYFLLHARCSSTSQSTRMARIFSDTCGCRPPGPPPSAPALVTTSRSSSNARRKMSAAYSFSVSGSPSGSASSASASGGGGKPHRARASAAASRPLSLPPAPEDAERFRSSTMSTTGEIDCSGTPSLWRAKMLASCKGLGSKPQFSAPGTCGNCKSGAVCIELVPPKTGPIIFSK